MINKEIISYCCGSYDLGGYGGVARYDYQLKLIFPNRKFFQGPQEKGKMLRYLSRCKNPLVITDNHLSCDIPNRYPVILVHHGCARTTSIRNPDWGEPWKSLCTGGQDKMLQFRKPEMTKIISISKACTDDFTKHYGDEYEKFDRVNILHTSELDEGRYKTSFSEKPIVLGNWNHIKKGQSVIPKLKERLTNFRFNQLNVKIEKEDIRNFNKRKQDIYLSADIFLQISNSEGNSYATLDALICGLPVVASDVGLFYKDVPEDCFVRMDWRRNDDWRYVKKCLEKAWENRKMLSENARKWYMKNCRFIDWQKKMVQIIG